MGTTSEKLTYLNTTKEKIRDSINLTGANIGTSDTFRSYASKLKKGYIDIINNGIDTLYNNFPKVSGIGSNLSLTPTYEAPIKLNEIQGDTLQDGTPTPDNPIEIENVTGLQNVDITGKNLFDKTTITTGKYIDASGNLVNDNSNFVGDYIPIDNTKSYYVSQSAGGVIRVGYYDSNKTFISRQLISANYGSLIIPNNTVYVRLSCYNQSLDTLQLEQNSTATEYEEYKSNTYEVNLGKNLFSSEMELGTLNNSTGLPATETNCIRTKDYISVNPNTTYIISNNKGYQQIVYQYDSSYNLIVANTQNSSFTTTSTTKYIKLRTGVSNVENDLTSLWQLEKGTQATSYSPYFTPIELNKIGDYQDRIYKQDDKWYVEKNTRKLELAIADMNNAEDYPGWKNQTQLYNDIYNGVIGGDLLNYTRYYTNISSVNYTGVKVNFSNSSNPVLYLRKGDFNKTQTEWKTNYPNLIFTIIYGMITPTTTEITNTELIEDLETLYTAKSQEGTTNISITSEDLEMILNVSALKGEV